MVSDQEFHGFGAIRNLGFQNVSRESIKEVHIYYLGERWRSPGEEKAILPIIEKAIENILAKLNLAVGVASGNMAKCATIEQDYLLIVDFHQEKKNISLVMCQLSTS